MSGEALKQHFGQIAPRYDELRLPEEVLTPQVETLSAAGDLQGRKVLDIGCGTGRILSTLARRYQIQGWGIDAEAALRMIRERHISTFALFDEEEYREGVGRAERDLPEVVTSAQEYLFIRASRPT